MSEQPILNGLDFSPEENLSRYLHSIKKYPILSTYKDRIDISSYECEIKRMLDDLKKRYCLDKLDSMLVLKDILYCTWKSE